MIINLRIKLLFLYENIKLSEHTNKMKEARISFLYVSSVRTWGSVHIEGT